MLLWLLGVVILFADGMVAGSQFGDLIAFFAAISLGAEFCLMGRVRPESVIPALGLAYTFPAILALPFVASLHVPAQSLEPVLFMGLVIAPVSFHSDQQGAEILPAPEVALFLLLETVAGALLVWAVLGEEPGRDALTGGMIILGTLAWHSTVDLVQERRQAAPLRS